MEKDETERTGRENDCLDDENRIVITLRRPASAPSMGEILRKEQPEEMKQIFSRGTYLECIPVMQKAKVGKFKLSMNRFLMRVDLVTFLLSLGEITSIQN